MRKASFWRQIKFRRSDSAMITEIKNYWCDGAPKDDDILCAIDIARTNNIMVRLEWFIMHSGLYTVRVKKDDTLDSVKERLPKVYGI